MAFEEVYFIIALIMIFTGIVPVNVFMFIAVMALYGALKYIKLVVVTSGRLSS